MMDQISRSGEYLVIVNPNAGSGKGKKDWEKISSLLEKAGLRFSERFTGKKEDAITFTTEGIKSGFRKIITVGGDGTLNEVVNGVLRNSTCPALEISLGLIPVGTGNDWGRMLGIPSDYEKAIMIIKEEKHMVHDAGIVTFFSETGKIVRYFINIAGLGFESTVVKRTNYQKDHGHSGKLIYFYNLLMSLLAYKNTRTEIVIDGEEIVTDLFSLNIGNGKYCGGGMRQTPGAQPDDGILDVTIIGNIGKLEIIRKLHMLYDGTILEHPKIKGYKCKNVRVTSGSVLWVEADGESLGHTPAEFGIMPSAINIIYGNRLI
jgi:diacylglycerol kinase (ATP)